MVRTSNPGTCGWNIRRKMRLRVRGKVFEYHSFIKQQILKFGNELKWHLFLTPLLYPTDVETEAQEGNGLTQGHPVVSNHSLTHSDVSYAVSDAPGVSKLCLGTVSAFLGNDAGVTMNTPLPAACTLNFL